MNKDNIIVDMKSPTLIDSYRFKSYGTVDIYIYKKNGKNSYTLEIKESTKKDLVLENCSTSMLKNWKVVEILRKKAYRDNKVVNVHDLNTKAIYKRITLATTLKQEEVEEAVIQQAKRINNVRRRMVVGTPFRNTKQKSINPSLIRPILREERTW